MRKMVNTSLALLFAASISAFAQRPATACNDSACGGNFDDTFTITNNTYQTLDIAMFVEKRSGEWKDLGLVTNVSSRDVLEDAFWSCDVSGKFMIYYRLSGSNDKFPTQSEVTKRMNYGYGN